MLAKLIGRCMPIPFSGCLIWDGWDDGAGYGKFEYKGKTYYVHRTIWELTHNAKIPFMEVLDHCKCFAPWCCAPAHLEPVTYKENTWRGKGRFTQFRTPQEYIPSTGGRS